MATSQFVKSTSEASDEVCDFFCSTCAENGKTNQARRYCRNCAAYLCAGCLQDHNKFPLMRSHVVTDTSGQDGDSKTEVGGGGEDVPKCSVHHANVIKFCKTHDEVCCQTCIAMKHRSCQQVIDISIASKDVLTCPEYKEKISSLTEVLSAMNDEKTKRHGNLACLANKKEKLIEIIDSYREDLHARIDILADESQRQIKMKYSEIESKDQSHISTLDTVIAITTQTLHNMSTQNEIKAFVFMKTNKNVAEECRALLHEMTHLTEDSKLEFTVNKDIMNSLNLQETLSKVAKRVAEKDDHMINKSPVSVKLFSLKTDPPDESLTKLLLSNLPSTVYEEFIELFFESKKKLNAGTVLGVDYDEEQHTAIVEFEDPASIGVVLNVCPLEMMGHIVNVEVYNPQPVRLCTVKVTGPTDIVCEEQKETLELYFDTAKKSAGGDLTDITFEENAAFVTFATEEVAQRVAEKKGHMINKKALEVQLYIPEPVNKSKQGKSVSSEDKATDESESEPIVTVKVKGIKDLKSKDTLEFYFCNARRSGGLNLKEIRNDEEDGDVLYLVYESAEVAKKVAEGVHVFEGVNLMTSLYDPPKPPPSYPNRVLIKGLKPTTTEIGLFSFIEAKTGYIPEPGSMIFHAEEEGVVMVTLDMEPKFDQLQTMCTANKLDGVHVKMYPVPISNCILVSNLHPDFTDNTVQFYFENTRKSGGGPVSKVTMNDDDTCFVFFENYEDVDSVLKREHYLSKQLLGVKRFLKCLGRTVEESRTGSYNYQSHW